MIKGSFKQTGSAHLVIITVIVLIIVGTLGFLFWNNFVNKKPAAQTSKESQTSQTKERESEPKVLKIKVLGKSLDLESAPYDDITYTQTSVNINDQNKYVTAIYSKGLNARLVADANSGDNSIDASLNYWKYSANRAVYAYYYNPSTNPSEPEMIDGVASNIINPEERGSASKFYVGFMGPGAPSTKQLASENQAFRDWVVKNLK